MNAMEWEGEGTWERLEMKAMMYFNEKNNSKI